MLQLGKDDEAYNFIKFWLKNTPVKQVKGKIMIFIRFKRNAVVLKRTFSIYLNEDCVLII